MKLSSFIHPHVVSNLNEEHYKMYFCMHYPFKAKGLCPVDIHHLSTNKYPSLTPILFKTLLVKALPVVIVLEMAASLY